MRDALRAVLDGLWTLVALSILHVACAAILWILSWFAGYPDPILFYAAGILALAATLVVLAGLRETRYARRGWAQQYSGKHLVAGFLLGEALLASWIALGASRLPLTQSYLACVVTAVAACILVVGLQTRRAQPAPLPMALPVGGGLAPETLPPPSVPGHIAKPDFVDEAVATGVTFDDVVGMEDAKRDLAETVYILDHPELRETHHLEPIRGILLHGPAGTGKTLFARAAAGSLGKRFLRVNLGQLTSKWFGETEHHIQQLFAYARAHHPCLLFFDEFDAIAQDRDAIGDSASYQRGHVNALLTELDGFGGRERNPIVIAATNRLKCLDSAVTRPGRFDRKILVPLPDQAGRVALLRKMLGNRPLRRDLDLAEVAEATEGWSPAALKALVDEAARRIFREAPDRPPRAVSTRDLLHGLGRGMVLGGRAARREAAQRLVR